MLHLNSDGKGCISSLGMPTNRLEQPTVQLTGQSAREEVVDGMKQQLFNRADDYLLGGGDKVVARLVSRREQVVLPRCGEEMWIEHQVAICARQHDCW